eukprot:SAG31_NODE_40749_length_279_cov_0.800000_1_plen_54_part_10
MYLYMYLSIKFNRGANVFYRGGVPNRTAAVAARRRAPPPLEAVKTTQPTTKASS